MPTARSYYGTDHVTEIPGVDVPGLPPEALALLSEERSFLQQRRAPVAPRYAAPSLGRAYPTGQTVRTGPTYPSGPSGPEKLLAAKKLRAEMMQLDAATQGPPLRWSYPGGQAMLGMDTDHMNAFQRALYLPQGSQVTNGGMAPSETYIDPREIAARRRVEYAPPTVVAQNSAYGRW